MEAQARTVLFYTTDSDKVPFTERLDSLRDRKARNKVKQRLDRFELGNFGDCKPVGGGVFELVIDYAPGYRVYFGQSSSTVVLLCGGVKSAQQQDILRAKEYWADYESDKSTDK